MNANTAVRPRVAFYAPMKSPNHATPSGDRRIARLTLEALRASGFDPVVVSDFRSLDMQGDAATQRTLMQQAATERQRLLQHFDKTPPALWFTYHCYYKAPDLLGSEVSGALGVPYVISEPSISPKRQAGAWATFTKHSEAAISKADRLFWTTNRDRPALENAGYTDKMTHLPAFVETPHAAPKREAPHVPLRLLTIAMMRSGDKVESYRRLAAALVYLDLEWHLTIVGDGSERHEVEALFADLADRVTFLGLIDARSKLAEEMRDADLFVWPGVGEGVGMVYLEAQSAGLPAIAEAHTAASELVATECAPANDPRAFANRITDLADPSRYAQASAGAHAHVLARHSLDASAKTLGTHLRALLK